jgi:16S rRNA (cytidine1402-2'-O)-methyltransferase
VTRSPSEPGSPGEGAEGRGGTLYVVATPIGNMADVTLRAIEILRAVPLIAAEDTRHTRRLLDRQAIATRTTSYHAQSGRGRTAALLDHLRGGADLALVTDAGTPAVSDPGGELVAAWATEGGTVVPIPGASAVLAAVAGSGVAGPRWSFEGFLPRTGRERRERLERIAADERGTVVFEAPGRVAATLRELATVCGSDRPGAVCRELTKLHESIVRGSLGELAAAAGPAGRIPPRGEFAIVVGAWPQAGRPDAIGDVERLAAGRADVDELVAAGLARGDAARRVAAATGLLRRRLYGHDDAAGIEASHADERRA